MSFLEEILEEDDIDDTDINYVLLSIFAIPIFPEDAEKILRVKRNVLLFFKSLYQKKIR